MTETDPGCTGDMAMRFSIPTIMALLIGIAGCAGKKSTPSSASGSSSGGDPVLGAVQNVRKAAQRAVTQNEMHNLHITMEAASTETGRLPSKDFILRTVQKEDPRLYQALQEGLIVLTEIPTREGIWAYEKDAPTNGGFVISQSGVERLPADQVKQRLKQ
jgi:hypothetical protein